MTDTFARMRQLVGTTAEWAANDLIIGNGELALEKLSGGAMRMKVGNGVDRFSVLPYFDPGVFSFVLKGGDTMTGPLIVPAVTVNAGGLLVSGGNSSFSAPVNLGPNATTGEPSAADGNNSKVPTTHWVQSKMAGLITGLEYKGTWNAATNTPPLASGGLGVPTPVRGDFYMVSVAGTTELDGNAVWAAGDFVAFNGIAWQRIPQPLTFDQIVAGLGYTPADDADLTTLEGDAIKRQIVDAAGDLIVGTAPDTVGRLPLGTAGQLLSSTGSAVAWTTGFRLLQRTVVSSAVADVSIQSIPSDINNLMFMYDLQPVAFQNTLLLQVYNSTGTLVSTANNYFWALSYTWSFMTTSVAPAGASSGATTVTEAICLSPPVSGTTIHNAHDIAGTGNIMGIRNTARTKRVTFQSDFLDEGGSSSRSVTGSGSRNASGLITGFRLVFYTGNIASGSFSVWGSP